jgi:mono/diheme cytochrome c family protein
MMFSKVLVPAAAALALIVMASLSGDAVASDAPAPEGEDYEQAALDYVTWCGPCHGRNGEGDGPVAASLRTAPPDLTILARGNGGVFPGEQVRQRIDGRNFPAAHGTEEMPVWGYWFKLQETAAGLLQEDRETAEKEVSERISRLVIYLENLQK